ncbi:MAG: polysaccharide deacetylase family protein [Ruminococcus sp.]|nr:polysaccharide deacetylase family protein [Ruminococcus sp.]
MHTEITIRRLIVILSVLALAVGTVILSAGRSGNDREALQVQSAKESRAVPIIMYHSILPDPERLGDYVVSPSQLESDMRCLKGKGFTAVSVHDLILFCEGSGDLPEKPVVLTFDDGQLNNLVYVLPLLERYDMCASFAPVGRYTEAACEEAEPSELYSYMDEDDLKKLLDSGRAELVCHSYDMHSLEGRRGLLRKPDETDKEYKRALLNDTTAAKRLFSERIGTEPEVYAYPYGFVSDTAREVMYMLGFKATLGTSGEVNFLSPGALTGLKEMGRFNRPSSVSSEEFISRIVSLANE